MNPPVANAGGGAICTYLPIPAPVISPCSLVPTTHFLSANGNMYTGNMLISQAENGGTYVMTRRIADGTIEGCRIFQGPIVYWNADIGGYCDSLPGTSVRHVAIKRLNPRYFAGNVENPYYEASIYQLLGNHENIVHFYEILQDNDGNLYLIMEYMQQDLLTYIASVLPSRLNEEEARAIFRQLLNGMMYMHRNGVVFRDFSLENVLIQDNIVKLLDFGMSAICPLDASGLISVVVGQLHCGKSEYMSPELFHVTPITPYDAVKADVWALGIGLFILIAGYQPWKQPALIPFTCFEQNGISGIIQTYNVPIMLSPELLDLINRMLDINTSTRISLQEIATHRWMN